MSVTFPAGFKAAGVAAGLKPSGAPDLALLVGGPDTTVAGLFTTNRVVAAPVTLSRRRLGTGSGRAVLVNAGQANAATGARGERDAERSTGAVARALAIEPDAVLACSTGVIGEPVHLDELLGAVPGLVADLSTAGGSAFAEAILTTDTVVKEASAEVEGVRVGGCAKGVGMISPRLATMLAFLTTDARVGAADLRRLADAHVRPAFESLTVDASTSTNDTVLLFASGAADAPAVRPDGDRWEGLEAAIEGVAHELAAKLIADAEGGTRVLVVDVEGAATAAQARAAAKAVADAPLVKAAAFGGDPNPGRILQAVGASGIDLDPAVLDVTIGGVPVVTAGAIPASYFDPGSVLAARAREAMAAREVAIAVVVGAGSGRSRVLGCDLSHGYVRINGEYTT